MDTIFIEYFTIRCPETVRDSSFSIYTYVDPNKLLRTRTQIILHLIEVSLNFTLLFTFALFKVIQVLKAIVSKLPEEPSIQKIVLDFERAIWSATRAVLSIQVNSLFHTI